MALSASSRRWTTVAALVALVAAALVTPADAARPNRDPAVVRTDRGPVKGTVTETYRSFQGIPFAAPPVGELRWRPPQPVAPWTEPRDATRPGNRCLQTELTDPTVTSGAEDCLYLNVATPVARHRHRLRPVMVWLHGGGFVAGSGSDYDGTKLAVGGDVVVVTVNYRLGIFGFFGYPGLPESGSFGLADQQAALEWVQRNAPAFGGDSDNVTLFGESAGSMSTCAHLTSPSARGSFHRAIMQSGTCSMDFPANTIVPGVGHIPSIWSSRSAVEESGSAAAAELGCSEPSAALACLRGLESAALLELTSTFSGPAFGNSTLPDDPAVALRAGRFDRMPIMIGSTRDEGRTFLALSWSQPITADEYGQLLRDAFGDAADEVAARYPLSVYPSPSIAWAAVTTDRVWACATLTTAQLLAKRVPTYGYEFADRDAPPIFTFPPYLPPGAYHGSELPYLFGLNVQLPEAQQRLADQMIEYWTRFAHTGDPNGAGLPHWSPLRRHHSTASFQSFAPDAVGPVDLAAEHQCELWSTLR